MVLKKLREGAEYPLNNMGLGRTECFAGLHLLGFNFGGRRSKSWHEVGAVVLGERSLEWAGGDIFPRTPALAVLSAGGVSGRLRGAKRRAWEKPLKPKSVKWKACVVSGCIAEGVK